MNKAIFLDRDGTINIDTGYIGNSNLVTLYPNVGKGIKKLKDEFGFKIIVISNQSGITRGLITSDDVEKVNNKINEILEKENTSPHMVFTSARDYNIDLKKSYFIGDKVSDIECGLQAGLKTILLLNTITESEINQLHNSQKSPNFISENFSDAVDFIIHDINGETFVL